MFSEVPYISIDRVLSHNMVSSILWKDDKVTKKSQHNIMTSKCLHIWRIQDQRIARPEKICYCRVGSESKLQAAFKWNSFFRKGDETWWGKRHMATRRLCNIMININIYIFTHQLIISHMADCLQIMSAASQNNLWNSVKMFVTWTPSLR